MAQGLSDLLKKQHKFGARDEVLEAKVFERMSGTTEDLEELMKRVRSILISSGKPCRVSEIEKDYRNLFGKKFPVSEIGFSTAVDVLKNIPGACTVEDEHAIDPLVRGKTTKENEHIFDLVTKSKNRPKELAVRVTSLRDVFVPFNVQDGIRQILYRKNPVRREEFYDMLDEKFDMQYMGLDVSVDVLVRSLPHLIHGNSHHIKSAYKIQKQEIQFGKYLNFETNFQVIPSYRLSDLETQIAGNISTLLRDNHFLLVSQTPPVYEKKFGKELNWKQFGFQDLWRFLQLLPGDFKLIKTDSDYIVVSYDIDTSGTTDVRDFKAENFCGELVYENVLKKIKHLILQVNKGLDSKYFYSAYESLYYEKLFIKSDFSEFLWSLHDSFIFTLKSNGDNIIIYPCNTHDIQERKIRQTEISESSSTEIVYPERVLKPGDSIKSLDFGKAITLYNNQFCAGYVSSIETPSNFCIRLIGMGPDHERELDNEFIDLTKKMKTFYSSFSEEYIIPIAQLKVDMICAVCVKGEWQRAVILDLINNVRIYVRLLDYGECHSVTLLNIRYLLKDFIELPCLVSKASLFNIQPKGLDWSSSAIEEFCKLTTHRTQNLALSVLIVHRNKDKELQVILTDVQEEGECHIGDKLVELGFAVFKYDQNILNTLFS